jgi:hypothetical protein
VADEPSDIDPDTAARLPKPARNLDMIGPSINASLRRSMRNVQGVGNSANDSSPVQTGLSERDIRSMVARKVPVNVNVCSVVQPAIRGAAQAPTLTNSHVNLNCAVGGVAVGR